MLLDGIPTIEITIGRQKKNPKSSPGRPFFLPLFLSLTKIKNSATIFRERIKWAVLREWRESFVRLRRRISVVVEWAIAEERCWNGRYIHRDSIRE
jgi:hypothetical protein